MKTINFFSNSLSRFPFFILSLLLTFLMIAYKGIGPVEHEFFLFSDIFSNKLLYANDTITEFILPSASILFKFFHALYPKPWFFFFFAFISKLVIIYFILKLASLFSKNMIIILFSALLLLDFGHIFYFIKGNAFPFGQMSSEIPLGLYLSPRQIATGICLFPYTCHFLIDI